MDNRGLGTKRVASFVAGALLLVLSALLTVSLLTAVWVQPQAGDILLVPGTILFGVYGYTAFLVPLTVLVASILLLVPGWSLRPTVLLAGSVFPFFTVALAERLFRSYALGLASETVALFVGVGLVVSALLALSIEYLLLWQVADRLLAPAKSPVTASDSVLASDSAVTGDSVLAGDSAPASDIGAASVPQASDEDESVYLAGTGFTWRRAAAPQAKNDEPVPVPVAEATPAYVEYEKLKAPFDLPVIEDWAPTADPGVAPEPIEDTDLDAAAGSLEADSTAYADDIASEPVEEGAWAADAEKPIEITFAPAELSPDELSALVDGGALPPAPEAVASASESELALAETRIAPDATLDSDAAPESQSDALDGEGDADVDREYRDEAANPTDDVMDDTVDEDESIEGSDDALDDDEDDSIDADETDDGETDEVDDTESDATDDDETEVDDDASDDMAFVDAEMPPVLSVPPLVAASETEGSAAGVVTGAGSGSAGAVSAAGGLLAAITGGKLGARKNRHAYVVPYEILTSYPDGEYWIIDDTTRRAAVALKETLNEFRIQADVTGIRKGPVITMFEILPAPGVKLSKIVGLADNIALRLAASSVRIVAPIPGKHAVGIEVPNQKRSIVSFRELIEADVPAAKKMEIPVVLGKDITGEAQLLDLAATPHLLIAGSTGSGKSVCVNSIILSILYKRSPEDVKLILIDPKIVELKLYNDIGHLLSPVITEPKKAFQALQYCLCEMERRYALLDGMGVRDIKSYNRRIKERDIATEKLPYIVIIIDEFADLMATTGKELESTVARLCAMSRAVGIHLVLATQRPSIDVITGLIKANIPTRIAFMVASKMDSRIIIDQVGAEKLLGRGDMLYAGAVDPFPVRIQGAYVSEEEVERVVEHVKTLGEPEYIDEEIFVEDDEDGDLEASLFSDGEDPLYDKALEIVLLAGKASASYIQRKLKIGYNRAARLVEDMESRGIVGPANGSKPREVVHRP